MRTDWRGVDDFVDYLKSVLIPDLEESGHYAMADDLWDAVEFLTDPIRVHVRGGVAYCDDSRVRIIDHDNEGRG